MSSSNIAYLSPFGVVVQAITILLSNPLLFCWYALPSFVFFGAGLVANDHGIGKGWHGIFERVLNHDGRDPVVVSAVNGSTVLMALAGILFVENLLLCDGRIAHQTATFNAKQHVHGSRVAQSTKITIRSANGQALAGAQLLHWLLLRVGLQSMRLLFTSIALFVDANVTGNHVFHWLLLLACSSGSALLAFVVIPIVIFSTSFMPVIIAVEGKSSIGDAFRRSASIVKQTYWKIAKFFLCLKMAFFGIGLLIVGLIALLTFLVDRAVVSKAEYWLHMAVELFVAPLLHIGLSVLYLQHRAEKEGLTVEKLAWELSGESVVAEKPAIGVAEE